MIVDGNWIENHKNIYVGCKNEKLKVVAMTLWNNCEQEKDKCSDLTERINQ